MSATRAGLAAVALAALTFSPAAWARSEAKLHCPIAASEQRIDAMERQLDAMDTQLDTLSDKVDQLSDQRREVLDEAKDRIESVVHDDNLSQDQVDRTVAHVLQVAQSKGEAAAREAQALQRTMDDLRTRMQTLRQQMKSLAGRQVDKDPDDS
jgi:peptidoglycan hydrolase CwlO-like protein